MPALGSVTLFSYVLNTLRGQNFKKWARSTVSVIGLGMVRRRRGAVVLFMTLGFRCLLALIAVYADAFGVGSGLVLPCNVPSGPFALCPAWCVGVSLLSQACASPMLYSMSPVLGMIVQASNISLRWTSFSKLVISLLPGSLVLVMCGGLAAFGLLLLLVVQRYGVSAMILFAVAVIWCTRTTPLGSRSILSLASCPGVWPWA